MQADMHLAYDSPNWRETLKSFLPIKDNKSKLALEPYPEDKVLVEFAKLAYSDCSERKPEGWYLLTTAESKYNGYFGCAVWNPSQQQVVIAHRGTHTKNLGAIWIDGKGIYCNKYTSHMSSAVSFADEIKKVIIEINEQHGSRFVVSFTGHSLGAWLAGVTTMTVKYLKRVGSGFGRIASPGEGLHAHTVALDSPGVEDMLIKLCRDYDVRYNRSMCTKQLDITTFFIAANLVNCTGFHVGGVRQVHVRRVALPSDSEKPTFMSNIGTHCIDNFAEAFKDGNETYVIENWPQGFAERKRHHEQEICCNSHILRPDAAEEQLLDPFEGTSCLEHKKERYHGLKIFSNDRDTGPFEGYKNKLVPEHEDEKASHYRSELSLGNSCYLGVFSTIELEFLQIWKLFQSNTIIKLTEIDKFISLQNLEKLVFPKFKLDTTKNSITCESGKHLEKVIGQTKQILRWFPGIMDALKKQNRSIKSAPLHVAGQSYLRTLPHILDCEDTLGLEPFLKSLDQRVLQIVTGNVKFEAARLHNILIRIKNTNLNKIYLAKKYHTFLSWNDMESVAKDVDIECLNKTGVTNDNLLILSFENPTDNRCLNLDLLGRILRNLETCSHKKLVIILLKPIVSHIFMKYNLIVETKTFKEFNLNDLTVVSREKIFSRDVPIIGNEPLSLAALFGEDCTSHDETVESKINKLISPFLKNLAIDCDYRIKIPNNLLRLCESDAFYYKRSKRVNKSRIIALLERTGADGPRLVISDPDQLSRDYWGEVAQAARERIFTAVTERRDVFQEKCREEPEKIIYWFNLSNEGLTLREVYNRDIFIPRKFHSRFIIKSINEFLRYSGDKDLFIFTNVEDKISLIRMFGLPKETEDIFIQNDHFKMRIPPNKMNAEDKIKDDFFNKHFFILVEIRGSPFLVWQHSEGSVDGLRPFITRDYSDPIEEFDFCNTKKKLVIIADDPGTGKTTSMTCISELIRDAWVLRIDHVHLDSATANLPLKLDLQSVAEFLIQASGLPSDVDFAHQLLQYCLESESSRKVCVLLDGFDQIMEEKIKIKMVQLLKFLKTATTCQTVVTTRVYQQEGLEKDLEEFSAELKKITEKEQEKYMVNSWLPHLALELPEHGELEKGRLCQFARELREEMEGVLGGDVANFMGIPLQISMMTEVFLRQAILSAVSPEQSNNSVIITNLFDLYTQFIEVKKTIYLDQKANIKQLPPFFQNGVVANILQEHYFLALRIHDPTFAKQRFPNIILSNEDMKDICTVGLIRSKTDGTFPFIHRTFQEYFCADFFVQWLTQNKNSQKENKLFQKELGKFLLSPKYKIIRMFIEAQLKISPIPDDAFRNHPAMYQHWYEHRQLYFHDHGKTPLHIAAEENNERTVAVLLGGPNSRTSEEAHITFIAARDKAGKTALDIASENGNSNILNQINEIVKSYS